MRSPACRSRTSPRGSGARSPSPTCSTRPSSDDPSLGSVETLSRLGTRAVLATPVIVFDRMIGVLALHRPEPGPWSSGDVGLAEAVARELGLALHTARLLDENERRLGEQSALLKAAQMVTSELELDAVLQRLVDEVAGLLRAEAVDCFLLDQQRGVLRCAAVHGSLEGIVGFEFPADRGLAGRAIARGRPVLSDDYANLPEAVPHPGYEGFRSAIVAPMRWSGEVMGILGVGTRDPARRFTQADAGLLEAFANLAALALRNAESFAERSRQARIQRGFYRIAAVLGQPISREETFDALAQAASDALGGASAAVLMPGEDDLRLDGMHELPGLLVQFLEKGLGDPTGPLRAAARNGRVLGRAPARGRRALRRGVARTSRARAAPSRCWPCRSRRRAPTRARSCSSSSPRSGASPTTTSSSPATSREPRAARSSAASCSKPSGRPARSRSSSRAPARCSPPSSTRPRCSTRSSARRRRCSAPTPR